MEIVVVNDAAQHITSPYRTFVIWRKAVHRSLLSNSLVWSTLIVVGNILGHGPVKMCLIDNDELVQALFSHSSNPAFSKGVGIWRLNQGVTHGYALRAKYRGVCPDLVPNWGGGDGAELEMIVKIIPSSSRSYSDFHSMWALLTG